MKSTDPRILRNYQLLVAGIEMTSSAATLADDMQRQGDLADSTGLPGRITHQVNPDEYLVLLWNWRPDGQFPLMTAVEVSSAQGQPPDCVVRRLPPCDYAVFPIEGKAPNMVESWPEIIDWYPLDRRGMRTTIRRYNLVHATGEILVPLALDVRPMMSR